MSGRPTLFSPSSTTSLAFTSKKRSTQPQLNRHELGEAIFENLRGRYDVKEQILGAPQMRYHERIVMLSVLDGLWKDHLLAMDHLKEGIGLRGLCPAGSARCLQARVFRDVRGHDAPLPGRYCPSPLPHADHRPRRHTHRVRGATCQRSGTCCRASVPATAPSSRHTQRAVPQLRRCRATSQRSISPRKRPTALHRQLSTLSSGSSRKKKQRELEQARSVSTATADTNGSAPRRTGEKIGRNDPCFCGSGKKYKKCHGAES